jgi:hypothetical protein
LREVIVVTLPPPSDDDEIAAIQERLVALDAEWTALEGRLSSLLTLRMERPIPAQPPSTNRFRHAKTWLALTS